MNRRGAGSTSLVAAMLLAYPTSAEPRLAPQTAALCAGATEVWLGALQEREPSGVPPHRLSEIDRARALYRAAVEELAPREPEADLQDLADQAFFEALAVWTKWREDGWRRGADGDYTPKARNARAAHAELMTFLDWCLAQQEEFADRFLGG